MSKLNRQRTIPYRFKVVLIDEVYWLFDDSERTFACSAISMCYAEPVLDTGCPSETPPREGSYWAASEIEKRQRHDVRVPAAARAPSVSEQKAWNTARTTARTVCRRLLRQSVQAASTERARRAARAMRQQLLPL